MPPVSSYSTRVLSSNRHFRSALESGKGLNSKLYCPSISNILIMDNIHTIVAYFHFILYSLHMNTAWALSCLVVPPFHPQTSMTEHLLYSYSEPCTHRYRTYCAFACNKCLSFLGNLFHPFIYYHLL